MELPRPGQEEDVEFVSSYALAGGAPPSASLLSISLASSTSYEKASTGSRFFQKMTSFTKKDKLLPRHASSPVFKYDNSLPVTPRTRVDFGSELSSDDDGDDEVDHQEEEEALFTLWERRVVRMVVDNAITRVDLRRLRLPAFPAGLLQATTVVTDSGTGEPVLEEALVTSSSLLDARLRKGKEKKSGSGRVMTRMSPASFVEVLDLRHNRITSLPDDIARMSVLRVLSLAYNKLTQVPPALFELSNLQTLDLSCNKLSSLTADDSLMEKMVSLKNLVLDSNQFVSLPSSLNKLTALQFLSVRKNQISSNHVASDLSGMVSLEGLDLSSNKLGEIPRQLCAFPRLRYLALADNQLTYIREEMPIASLSALAVLDLSNNMLYEVGPQAAANLCALPNLTELRLTNNQLQALPEALSQLLEKGVLSVDDNEALANGGELSEMGIARSYPMLGRNRGLHKKASTQDIREFLGVYSTAASRNSINVAVNPLAIETPITSPRFDGGAKDEAAGADSSQETRETRKKKADKKSAKKKGKDSTSRGTKSGKGRAARRRNSSSESSSKSANGTVRRGSDADAEWHEAWKRRSGGKAKSDYSEGEGQHDGDDDDVESGYESSKSNARDDLTEDESSYSSSEGSSPSSGPSSGIKKKGKAILEFISRDRIKRDDEASDEPATRSSWLWRKGSREKVTERDNTISPATVGTAAGEDSCEPFASSSSSSQPSPRGPLTSTGSLAQGLVLPCAGWRIHGTSSRLDSLPQSKHAQGAEERYQLEEEANYSFAYRDLFFPSRHANFMGIDPVLGPVTISILKTRDPRDGSFLYIMRYDQSTSVGHIPAECYRRRRGRSAALLSALKKAIHPTLAHASLASVKDEECKAELLKLEEQMLVAAHKFGVIFAKENQITENELFSNQEGDDAFEAFLELLGPKIELKGWKGYTGGLNTGKSQSDGTHSVFTQWKGLDIMFHVSTMIPYNPKDEQQIGRKRHIGNDVAVLVFVSGKTPFSPISIQSQFNNVFIVVQLISPDDSTSPTDEAGYKVAVTVKSNIPDFGPTLPEPPVFYDPADFREFLLTKLVNSERAAYKRNQLGVSIQRTRNILLLELIKKFAPDKLEANEAQAEKTRTRSQSDSAASSSSSSATSASSSSSSSSSSVGGMAWTQAGILGTAPHKRRKNATLPTGSTAPMLFSSSERDVPLLSPSASSSSSSSSLSASAGAFSRTSETSPRGKQPSVPSLALRSSSGGSGTDRPGSARSGSISASGSTDRPGSARSGTIGSSSGQASGPSPRHSPGPSPRAGHLTPHTLKRNTSRSKIEQQATALAAPSSGSNSPRTPRNGSSSTSSSSSSTTTSSSSSSMLASSHSGPSVVADDQLTSIKFWKRTKRAKSCGSRDK